MTSRSTQIVLGLLIVAVVALMVSGVLEGSDDSGGKTTTADEAKRALRQLPYRYKFRPVDPPGGAESAIAGTAYGRHGAAVNFGAAFGQSPKPIPVPGGGAKGALKLGNAAITADRRGGVRGKSPGGPHVETTKQSNEADAMAVRIPEKLCEAATGEACPGGGEQIEVKQPPSDKSEAVFRTIDQGPIGK